MPESVLRPAAGILPTQEVGTSLDKITQQKQKHTRKP